MVTKYYAVVSGREPGIYTDWSTAERMIKGFPGAVFKSFRSRADAESFMRTGNVSAVPQGTMRVAPETLPLINKTTIYTDGSCTGATPKDRVGGFGVVIITSNGDKITAHGRVPVTSTNNVAELYAIYVALSLVRGDVVLYSDSTYAISALTVWIHDWMKRGWSGVANRQIIEEVYKLMEGREVVMQHVAAHCGIKYNEEADRLANEGRNTDKNLIITVNGVVK